MGNLFCCLHPEDPEEHDDTRSSQGRSCFFCPNCLLHPFFTKYATVVNKEKAHMVDPAANTTQSDAIMTATPVAADTTTTTAHPQNMSSDANPSHSIFQQDGLTLPGTNVAAEAAAGQFEHNDMEEKLRRENGINVPDKIRCEVPSNEYNSSTSPIRHSKEKVKPDGFFSLHASHDDDDVCPTCLEEYTFDNPRILSHCNHHYHLACIYEWKERSETCPVCGKVMVFDEI